MPKLPEPIKAEGNEDVTNRNANDADESSLRKILIVLYCIVQVEEHRDGCTWPSRLFYKVEQHCGCPGGRPQTVVRDPLRLAMMRSGDCCSAKQVYMTCTEDTTMNEDKQCSQRDVTEVDVSRRGAGRTRLMFV